ncbi:hypothetical protein ACFOOK_28030 [Micromonospora krabiensis]|uniref:Uncharacterized protein n=1 Tax=Micromonospora krabiensis TaxID=307121 RepID=A0A1C3N4R3_9ACTN|nr:hypothetical protein [Micromonospora krabiensis]SBV27582.1 hypothetical protein GA0070620_3106 [Micromonospora krabiensis]
MTTRAVRVWYAMTVTFVVMIAFAGASVIYANHAARESEQKWCGLVTTLDRVYTDNPPQTPVGRDMAAQIRQLRIDFDCP